MASDKEYHKQFAHPISKVTIWLAGQTHPGLSLVPLSSCWRRMLIQHGPSKSDKSPCGWAAWCKSLGLPASCTTSHNAGLTPRTLVLLLQSHLLYCAHFSKSWLRRVLQCVETTTTTSSAMLCGATLCHAVLCGCKSTHMHETPQVAADACMAAALASCSSCQLWTAEGILSRATVR